MVAIVLIIDFFIMLFGEDERKDGIIVLILTIIGIFTSLSKRW